MAKTKRTFIQFQCTVCKNLNYTSVKNQDNAKMKSKGDASKEKLLLKKWCKHCRKVTEHKEVKL